MKVLDMRIKLSKFRNQFDSACEEALLYFRPKEYLELIQLETKTEEQQSKFDEMTSEINKNYMTFVENTINEEVDFNMSFTKEEYLQIADVNINNDVDINGNKFTASDFLEILYNILVIE